MKYLSDALEKYKGSPSSFFWTSGCDFAGKKDFYWWGSGKRVTYAEWWPTQPDNCGGNEYCILLGYGCQIQKFGLKRNH